MNGKYSDHAAQDLRSNDEMLSSCAFAQADLNIFFLAACKHQRHSLVNNGNSDLIMRVLAVRIWQKKKYIYANHVRRRRFIFVSPCAGLSLSPLLS